jgi:hypothetical protein
MLITVTGFAGRAGAVAQAEAVKLALVSIGEPLVEA